MSTFEEYAVPGEDVFCVAAIHHGHPSKPQGIGTGAVHASWLVRTTEVGFQGSELPLCTSCHFWATRQDRVLTERRLSVPKLVCVIPEGLDDPDLRVEIDEARGRADLEGYMSGGGFYDLKNMPDGSIRLTFRKF